MFVRPAYCTSPWLPRRERGRLASNRAVFRQLRIAVPFSHLVDLMDPNHLQELIDLEESYWWHVAKRRLVMSLLEQHVPLPARVVEGGIGSARNLVEFQRRGYQVAGFDLMEESVAHAKSRGIEDVCVHDLQQPWPLDREPFDAVVMLDVIEHVEDPVKVLSHAARVLTPSGVIIVTVPAYPCLYSEWDKRLGHYRRYTRKMLRDNAEQAGLTVNWMQHWNAFSLPPALVVRGYQRLFPRERSAEFPRVRPWLNQTLLGLAGMERWCMKKGAVRFGLSLAGVLGK